jgi:hypothetical protein
MSRRTFLADDEFDQVQELARSLQRPITTCPTCQTKQSTLDKDPDYKPTYRLFGKEYDCDCKQQITLFTHYLRAGIPEEYMRLDWTTYNGSGRDFVDGYLGNWRGYWKHGFGVEFGGRTMGIGKTFCACHIGKELLKQGQKVYFTPFVEMVAAFEKENGHELERRIRMSPYVILDDIMPPISERQAAFYHTRFEAIIRHRTNYNLPTVITTNLSAEDLEDHYPRTYSLLAAKQVRIDMDGNDYRHNSGLENMELALNDEVRPIT